MAVGALAGVDRVGGLTARAFLDSSGADPRTLRARVRRDGYAFFRALLDRDVVLATRRLVLARCAARGWLRAGAGDAAPREGLRLGLVESELIALQADVQVAPEWRALAESWALRDAVSRVACGAVASGYGDVCRLTTPHTPELTTPPHQDHHFTRCTPCLWTAWIPLGDCPAALGGLQVLPGSHRAGVWAHEGEREACTGVRVPDDARWRGGDYRCGDVLVFGAMTVHRARPNVADGVMRLSADFRFAPVA